MAGVPQLLLLWEASVAVAETAVVAAVDEAVRVAGEVLVSACEAKLELCSEEEAVRLNCASGEAGVPEQTVGTPSSSLRLLEVV